MEECIDFLDKKWLTGMNLPAHICAGYILSSTVIDLYIQHITSSGAVRSGQVLHLIEQFGRMHQGSKAHGLTLNLVH